MPDSPDRFTDRLPEALRPAARAFHALVRRSDSVAGLSDAELMELICSDGFRPVLLAYLAARPGWP
ncbi:MAG TPA: hypothetical protein VEB20_16575 [Azospirillaceae bacterium]|nr:hypothetical protein [Azospirillaceae bacterium]